MALEALKQYAAEQNQATQAEIDKLLKNDALKRPTSDEKGKGNIKPLVNKENVIEALQERLARTYKEHQENINGYGGYVHYDAITHTDIASGYVRAIVKLLK